MKKALVVGASGGIGFALVKELVGRNIEVVAFSRGEEKLQSLYGNVANVTVYSGDVFIKEHVMKAAKDVDVIFHTVSFPYQEWHEKHLSCINILIDVAEANGAKIALVDNVYAYGRQSTQPINEKAEKRPHTKKGKIRLEMENRLKESRVPMLIVHMPDIYGPNAENTILNETLKNVVKNKTAIFVGNQKVAREYLYSFDGAKAMIELALRDDAYDQNWNIPAVHPIKGEELLDIFKDEFDFRKSLRTVSTTMIRFLGFFQPFMKELVEMMYLTEEPVVLSGEKYEREVGPIPKTPYKEVLKETIRWMKDQQ